MEMVTLGRTGLQVSRLGVGLAELGHISLDEVSTAENILVSALDGGINFFDTAECYGNSEELIGNTVSHRRHEIVLATKAGHVSTGSSGKNWTGKAIKESIDSSLRKMRTDYLDIVQLHAYDVRTPISDEVIRAIVDAKDAGKTRFLGYSGENEDAEWAVETGLFDTLQSAYNLMDQKARYGLFEKVKAQEMGFIAKRPIGNAVWGKALALRKDPKRDIEMNGSLPGTSSERLRRAKLMQEEGPIPGAPEDHIVLALGFVLASEEVHTAIVGTRSPEHMISNINVVNDYPPVQKEAIDELKRRHDQFGRDWPALDV